VVVGGLLIAAAAYASIPVFLPTNRDWLSPAFRLAGAALLLLIATAYGWAHARGAALVNGPEGFRLRAADVGLLLAFPLYLLFVGNGLVLTSADNIPTVALGPVLLERGTIDLSSVRNYQKRRLHYSAVRVGGRILSAYPLGTGLLSVPYVALTSRSLQGDREVLAQRRDKHLAALLTVAASVMLFAGVRRLDGDAPALATAVVFAAGTTVLSSASQALWSLTGALFFLTAALWMLLPEPRSTTRARSSPAWRSAARSSAGPPRSWPAAPWRSSYGDTAAPSSRTPSRSPRPRARRPSSCSASTATLSGATASRTPADAGASTEARACWARW
jgi:hypothetical protein